MYNNYNNKYNNIVIYNNNIDNKFICLSILTCHKISTQRRDIQNLVIFRFLQIFYGLTMKRKV